MDAATSPAPTAGSYISEEDPSSKTSTKIFIVAAAVGITLALFLIGFFYWRKKNRQKKDDLDKTSYGRPPSVSVPLGSNWGTYTWDPVSTFAPQTKYKDTVGLPEPSYARPGTSGSNRAMPTRAPFAPPNMRSSPDPVPSYLPPTSVMPRQAPNEPRATSPELPLQRPETRPSSMSQDSTLVPPPPKASRFSRWTNSQIFGRTPKTPVTPKVPLPQQGLELDKDIEANRYSTVSDAESVARYRTVESWVGQQAGRYEEARIQERIGFQLDEAIGELHRAASTRDDKRITRMKTIPLKDSSSVYVDGVESDEEGDQVTELSLVPEAVRKASVKRTKSTTQRRHKTNESDMTVFRAHPGTKVDIPNSARIPSAVLDSKFAMNGYPYGGR